MNLSVRSTFFFALAAATLAGTPASAQLRWERKLPANSPSARYEHTMVRAHPSYDVYLFGGRDANSVFGDTWSWNGNAWTLRATSGPSPRHDHAMDSYHFEDDSLLLFGGRDATGALLGDTWIWNGSSWAAISVTPSPSPRAGHAIAKDEWEIKTLLLFGGRTAQGLSNETWRFVGHTWSLVPTTGGPSPREGHALVRGNEPGHFLLVGGRNDVSVLSDVWEFDGAEWHELGSLPQPRADAATVFEDMWRYRVLQFGGDDGSGSNLESDTREHLGNGVWAAHETLGEPIARKDAAMGMGFGFDHSEYVLFGGRDASGAALGDTLVLRQVAMPSTELVGQGCGPGAWGPTDGPSLMATSPLLGGAFTATAFVPSPGLGAFVIGSEFDPPSQTSCGLQLNPVLIVMAPALPLFEQLATSSFTAQIPFVPAFAGAHVSMQSLILEPTAPGGMSISRVLRLNFAE